MPTEADIQKAAERREKRKLAREAAVQQAHQQEVRLPETIKTSPRKPAPVHASTKEQRAAARKAREAEADQQDRSLYVPQAEFSLVGRGTDKPLSLHELNKLAKQNNAVLKEDAREIAKAAGKAAYEAASGRRPNVSARRYKNMRDAQAALDAQKAKQAQDEQRK